VSIDSLSRSARRFLTARLDRLQQTLEAFGQRVRESLAALIGGHSGDTARDTLHAVLRNGRQLRPNFLDIHPDDRFDLHDVAQDEMRYDDEPKEFWREQESTPLAAPAYAKPPSRWRRMLTAGLHKGVDLAGFHLSFGLAVLSAEFARARHAFRLRGRALLDAQTIYRRKESRDLRAAVRQFLGREYTNAHSARVDVHAAIEALDAQLGVCPDLPRTPAALHAELVEVEVAGWFRRDEQGQVVFAAGEHAGKSVAAIARESPASLHQLLEGGVLLEGARTLLRRALAGRPLLPLSRTRSAS